MQRIRARAFDGLLIGGMLLLMCIAYLWARAALRY